MTIKAPVGNLRQFLIGSEIHIASDDEYYYLIFTRAGGMFVQVFYSPNKQYASAWWGAPIQPADFAKHAIEGRRLDQVVAEFLDNKLPTE